MAERYITKSQLRSWTCWRSILDVNQRKLVNRYLKRFKHLFHPCLSILCPRGKPAHHADEVINRHLRAFNWQSKFLPEVNKSLIAYHLFQPDKALYYVSNKEYGLLAFDIDAKEDQTDAQDYAKAIQDRFILNRCSWIQPSTGGKGAYLYVPVVLGTEIPNATASRMCSKIAAVVKDQFSDKFKSELDGLKGTFPVIDFNDKFELECRNQGVLVRAPEFKDVEELDTLTNTVKLISFTELMALFGLNMKRGILEEETDEKQAPLSPSSSPPDTHAHKSVGSSKTASLSPLSPHQRVVKALKDFRDKNRRDPKSFDEFNFYYEQQGLNTGAARPARRQRYERILDFLEPYRPTNTFNFDSYSWLIKYVTPELIAKVKGTDRHEITLQDLAIVQYATGLATVTQEKDPQRQNGLPLSRIAAVYRMLAKAGVIEGDYDLDLDKLVSKLKSKLGIAKRILIKAGLIFCIKDTWDLGESKKYVVTPLDEVFGPVKAA